MQTSHYALDVTIQAQILDLMNEIKQTRDVYLMITHDMGVIAEVTDRVGVMYAGKIVSIRCKEHFTNPMHPYS